MFYGIISVLHCRKKNLFKNTFKFGLTIGFLLKKKKEVVVVVVEEEEKQETQKA